MKRAFYLALTLSILGMPAMANETYTRTTADTGKPNAEQAQFYALDVNHDGVITLGEFQAARPQPADKFTSAEPETNQAATASAIEPAAGPDLQVNTPPVENDPFTMYANDLRAGKDPLANK